MAVLRGRRTIVFLALLAGACSTRVCGGLGGLPPDRPPLVRGPDGKQYHLLDRGPYKAYYDRYGRLQRIEYDSNADGKPDQIAYHDGAKSPALIEVDQDKDGKIDRWEYYDTEGKLLKVGSTRRGGRPDAWSYAGPDEQAARVEYDDDGDGRLDRVEVLQGGVVVEVHLDADHDGRFDRWQQWRLGQLVSEGLDTNGDGKPDRRIRYGERGKVLGLESVAP